MLETDAAGFFASALGDTPAESLEDAKRWLQLLQEIWNRVPQPDRGGQDRL
jgi:hypothetical protein